jgi:type I restriction enzyme S subunit
MITTETTTKARRELPNGWRWVKLGELCDFVYGASLPETKRKAGSVPVYGSNGVVGSHDEALTSGPCLVIGRKGSIGEVHYSHVPCWPIDTTYYIESTRAETDFFWLYNVLKSLNMGSLNKAAAIPGLNRQDVYDLDVAFPPLPEQQRIAALLNDQTAAVERARAAAEARLEAARALPAAYLREVFEGEEARGWPVAPLGTVGDISSGITLGRRFEGVTTRRVPYLRVANVKDGYLDLSDVYEVAVPESDIQKCRLQQGDLLLTEGGDPDKLGRGSFWQEQLPECIHQNHIFRVRFDLSQHLPDFLSAQIGSSYGKAYFLAHAKQTTGIATINQRVLADFPLMLPPLTVQERVVGQITKQLQAAKAAIKVLQAQFDDLNFLPAALLRQAFSGEL